MLKSCFNSHISKTFKVDKVLSRGAPLAPYLFILVGKMFNHMVKEEYQLGNIKGIALP
jgi:hypothetical protein